MYEQDNKNYSLCQECEKNNRKQKKCCIDVIIFVLSILFALNLGLIIASIPAVAPVLFGLIATLIILGINLLVLIIIREVEKVCDKCQKNRC